MKRHRDGPRPCSCTPLWTPTAAARKAPPSVRAGCARARGTCAMGRFSLM
ncbi:hypothetical protein HMPREF1317_2080 [Schaalia georgiae F0490]|uniref:Uncharacterized protein n=1 Tax=Schaalia georgiae F0490 TaxID=1125717 RepID=J0XCP6_9ACTO|nr:hypothetical protein HMPREF1317_2080 [Schaalia georgiae F0490]